MNTLDETQLLDTIRPHLHNIYKGEHPQLEQAVLSVVNKYLPKIPMNEGERYNQSDVMLITYGDSLLEDETPPLQSLYQFLHRQLPDTFSCVHILPFFPFSSDDGFSVIDYRQVNPKLGDWQDINRIAGDFRLMVDLVINHISRESLWFYDFVADRPPANDYFIDLPEDTDTHMVTRPRSSPLLVPVNTHRGTRHLWATFSEDQIDLNFANPDVLVEFIDILLFYIANGAQLIRLDAIAFLWKQLGTNCIHLKETHEVVKLMRDILSYVAPRCILLTETNVPHEENLSYMGDGDEAHMVYQFSLPPLVLHAMNRGTSKYLTQWALSLGDIPEHCTYLNFTASHDGVGLRALEGILPTHEVEGLIDSMHRFGGFVSMKANPNGQDSPYEINISYFDAMQGTRRGTDQWQVARFICSQAIMLAMKGMPAMYIHSILATPNDLHGVEMTGRTRSINRKRWHVNEIEERLKSHNTPNAEVFNAIKRIIAIRREEPCFHPDGEQEIIDISTGLFAFIRYDVSGQRRLFALFNITSTPQPITIKAQPDLSDSMNWFDLIEGRDINDILANTLLHPYQIMWLVETTE